MEKHLVCTSVAEDTPPWSDGRLGGMGWLSGTTAHHCHQSQGRPRQPFLCLKKKLGLLPADQLTGCCGAERPLPAHPLGRVPGSLAGKPGPCKHHGCSTSPAVLLPRVAWSCCSLRGQLGGPWGHCVHCVPTLSPAQQWTNRQGGKAKRWTIPPQAEPGNFPGDGSCLAMPIWEFEQSLHHCRAGTANINTSTCAPTHVPGEQHEEEPQHKASRSNMAKWVTWT